MKRTYSQPDIVFESFSLCTSIAGAGCIVSAAATPGSCALDLDGINIFISGVNACEWKITDGSAEFNYLCYHVPTGDNNLFNS